MLRVVGLDAVIPLDMQQVDGEDYTVTIPGWSRYGKQPQQLALDASLDRKTFIEGVIPGQLINAWTVMVPDACNYPLQGRYSGASVIDTTSGKVVAVVYLAEENRKRGMAVSISALPLIWPDAPAILRTPVEPPTPDPILPFAPSMVPVYLAAHQRLRGLAHGQSGETVIDWTQAFAADDPDPAVWEQQLIPDLERYMQLFRRDQQRRIALRAEARNSAGLVFGYIFCERAGFHIQYTDRDGAVWRTDGERQGPSPVNRSETTMRKKGTDMVIELAVTQGAQSVQRPVDGWIAEHRLPVRKRIMLERPHASSRLTPAEGGVIAEQVCAIISDEVVPGGTVHLFGALPLGIALLIGWRMKAGRTIQFYDLNPTTQRYQPTCLLRT